MCPRRILLHPVPVGGERSLTAFSQEGGTAVGPGLSGMGRHHPPAYFAEAIINPDAVLVDGPGYVGDDGHSIMPSYAELTVGELSDLVAYLVSLRGDGGPPSCHAGGGVGMPAAVTMSRVDLRDRPLPPADAAHAFFAQTYDVLPGKLAAFESWFATDARRAFAEVAGLVRVDTFVDPSRPGPAVTSVFAFRDEVALRNFLGDPASVELWNRFDAFVGPHGHLALGQPLVYRASSLSTE